MATGFGLDVEGGARHGANLTVKILATNGRADAFDTKPCQLKREASDGAPRQSSS